MYYSYKGAFSGCTSLTSVTLPANVRIIGNNSFYGCSNLSNVVFPDTIEKIGAFAFSRCGLTSLVLPEYVEQLNYAVFSKCTSLSYVTIKNIEQIGWATFDSCISLTTVNFNADSCWYGAGTGYNIYVYSTAPETINGRLWSNCPNLTTINIGNNVKLLKSDIFNGVSGITEITIPPAVKNMSGAFNQCTGLTTVNYNAKECVASSPFSGCLNLTNLNIGDSVEVIPYNFMSGITSLHDTLVLSGSVREIGYNAFSNVVFSAVFVNSQTPPVLGETAFSGTNNTDLYVPCGTGTLYATTDWGNFRRIIDPQINIIVNAAAHGIAEIVASPSCQSDTAVIRAVADSGYRFDHWSDGDSNNPRTLVLTSDTILTAYFDELPIDCDSVLLTLPIVVDFTQCWATEGGAAIAGTSRASLNGSGQTLTSPWMSTSAGTVYYTFTDRRDTTGALWYNGDSVVYYDVSVETAEGVVSTTHWNSENHSINYISHFPNPGMPFHLVFTYTDTRAVNLHYIENLEVYAYDLTLVVEGPTDVNMGDTTTYTAHVTMPDDGLTTYWDWTLYDQIYQSVPDSIATVIASTDSTRTIVWHSLGYFHLCTTVQKYIPQSVWQFHHHYITVNDTTSITPIAVDCDSISLPYEADFTQCWTAEGGASIIDSNHASITSAGQKITSPWMQSVAGNTYLAWTQQREGDCNYETEQFVITIEDENGVVQSWTESAGNWGSSVNNFTSPGGPIRVSFEYIGSNIVPSFRISDVAIYSYFIEMEIESPAIAQIGDTVTLVAHASLQNGDSLDGKYWYMFDAARHYYSLPPYDDDTTVTIVSQTDNTLSLVWNSVGRYSVTINGYKNVFRGHNAYANASQDINIVNHSFYEEDSIYYTSETKDTVIGCHPQLHSANLPESVRVIKDSAFFNLDNLSSVSLPDGLEQIGKMAFAWNQGITEISLPRGLQYVGDNAFWWDTNLVVINFNADSCRVMSPSTASDGNYCPVFIGCDNVTTINIGENVTRIPDRAFSYCSKLRGTLVIPDAVTYIGTSAFYHWYENWEADNDTLQVVLGSGLTEIGDYAFGCPRSQLSSVISRAAVPPTIYEQTFYRYGQYTPVLWVPCGSTQAYRTAQHWNRIEDIREDCDGIENPSEENNMKVYSISGNIVVTNAPDEIVTIYDMMGRVVLSSSITNENVHLPLPSAGVYMVKIGSLPAQKVVVMR